MRLHSESRPVQVGKQAEPEHLALAATDTRTPRALICFNQGLSAGNVRGGRFVPAEEYRKFWLVDHVKQPAKELLQWGEPRVDGWKPAACQWDTYWAYSKQRRVVDDDERASFRGLEYRSGGLRIVPALALDPNDVCLDRIHASGGGHPHASYQRRR